MPEYRLRRRIALALMGGSSLLAAPLVVAPLLAASLLAGQGATAAQAAVRAPASGGPVVTVAGGVGGPGPARRVALGTTCTSTFWRGSLYLDTVAPGWVGGGVLIRKISAGTGQLSTPAGNLVADLIGIDRIGPSFQTAESCGVTLNAAGDIFWPVSLGVNEIRMRAARSGRSFGRQLTAGRTYVLAGSTTPGSSGDGGPAADSRLFQPAALAIDSHGNLVFADTDNNRIRVIAASTGAFYGRAMVAGDIYSIAGGGTETGNGVAATAALLRLSGGNNGSGAGLRLDRAGNLVIADATANEIRVIAGSSGTFYGQRMLARHIYTIAGNGQSGDHGDGGPATRAATGVPGWVAIDRSGNVIFSQVGRIRIVAQSTGRFYGKKLIGGRIYGLAGLRGYPACLSVDGHGNLLFCTSGTRNVQLLGNKAGRDFGRRIRPGQVITVAGDGQLWEAGNGGQARRAQFSAPFTQRPAIAVDRQGDVALTDNHQVRFVPSRSGTYFGQHMSAGDIYPVTNTEASGPDAQASALAFDGHGNLLLGDLKGDNIWVVARRAGTYYGLRMGAGSAQSIAFISQPAGVAVDANGNVVTASGKPHRILVIAASKGTFYGQQMIPGHTYVIAGTGGVGTVDDSGPAIDARIARPTSLAIDHFGDVLFSENSGVVELIAEQTGTIYAQAVTSGNLYSVGWMGATGGIAIDRAGNLLTTLPTSVQVTAVSNGRFYGAQLKAGHSYDLVSLDSDAIVHSALSEVGAIGIVPGRGFAIVDGGLARLVLAQP